MLWKRLTPSFVLATAAAAAWGAAGVSLAQDKPAEEKKEEKAAEPKADEKKPAEEKKADEEKKPAEEKKADEKKPEGEKPAGVEAVTLVTNLENPSGIAVHGKTGHVFVASRYGIYRYDPKGHSVSLEISGYPTDVYGKGPMYDIGPLGVGIFGEDTLIVSDGSRPDGEELVRTYKISDAPADMPAPEGNAEKTFGPIKEGADTASGEKTTKPEGNFYDIAVGDKGVFITSNGDDTKGWIHKIDVTDGKLGDKLVPTIATKADAQVDAPVPVEFSADKSELYVGQMGEINVPNDSLLLVYDPNSGELKTKYSLGLHDPAGLAVSPKTKKIYVTDFAWAKPEEAGLFEVTIEGDKATTKRIDLVETPTSGENAAKTQKLQLDKPTALAFDKDGKLYLTVMGTVDEKAKTKDGEQLSPGKLMVIDAGL
jgi:DNA-binding beta-propeller fold protein YncE